MWDFSRFSENRYPYEPPPAAPPTQNFVYLKSLTLNILWNQKSIFFDNLSDLWLNLKCPRCFLAKKWARHMVLELEIPSIDSKSVNFRTLCITPGYKLNHKTYGVGFWCVRKLRCWVLQIFLRELPGGAQGGSPKDELRDLEWKNCIFWLKMAISVAPAPSPWAPLMWWKKVIDIFQKISQYR